ncbi:WS/DGAT/MGAT family O-acyltransferase [Smaragdicoccus niigatensis]|uniref:WS/DGAT/MGAT family O-acyltransferase n=1 Tax=Smaragdicoccus niigatensis TaxID=359359 RepID=UPI00037AAA42|nr:wax ester/triacylglycerol synthase family O-acyltransferase [Smaragdicoccus niigatensis]
MRLISPADYIFLALEGREQPFHVGGLQLFTPPEGSGPEFARELYQRVMETPDVAPRFRQRLGSVSPTPQRLTWRDDTDIDLDYHVQLSALPRPGRIRELLEMTSRWHSTLLDRHRPLWEMHIVEGLEDGRVAVYTKMHHALADGVTALRLLQNSLSSDPDETGLTPIFAPRKRRHRASRATPNPLSQLFDGVSETAGLLPAAARIGRQIARERDIPRPMTAPKTMFNTSVGGARRFAAQSWEIARIKNVAKSMGCTLNDVVLAMCGGALRAYLEEQNALPDAPLVAFVPISLHGKKDNEKAPGNSIGLALANLGTDTADPAARLSAVRKSMGQAKQMMSGLTPAQAMAVSATMLAPSAAANLTGTTGLIRPTFNVIISNVPGPRETLYWDGARLDGIYPASIVMNGAALNITLTSNAHTLDFGITGCRTAVPHLQRLLGHLDVALKELENVAT